MTSPTDPRRFLYRADALDPDLAQKLAREALAKADDGELYLQYRRDSESLRFRRRPAEDRGLFDATAGSACAASAVKHDGLRPRERRQRRRRCAARARRSQLLDPASQAPRPRRRRAPTCICMTEDEPARPRPLRRRRSSSARRSTRAPRARKIRASWQQVSRKPRRRAGRVVEIVRADGFTCDATSARSCA
jgi:TldD protein